MKPPYDSLRFRLMASAGLWIVVGLAIAGVIITEVFRSHLTDQFRKDLEVHLTELAATADVDAAGRPHLRHPLSDPRFISGESGYYWQVERDGQPMLRSPSLAEGRLSGSFARSPLTASGEANGPNGRVLEYGRTVKPAQPGPALRLSIASDLSVLATALESFRQMLIIALLVFGLVLLIGGALQLTFGLRPLDRLAGAIARIRAGAKPPEPGEFPREIRPLIQDLSALLTANATIVQRARVQAGNLAHGLRTPLAIVMDEAERLAQAGQGESARSLLEQCQKMQKQIDYHMARSRSAAAIAIPGQITPLVATLSPILAAMHRLHGRRGVWFDVRCADDLTLACDPLDFAEITSALLDNAGKWATSRVEIDWRACGEVAQLTIDDDGPGLEPESRETVFVVGERLDDTVSGSGLGLAIARDLATLYGGAVKLEDGLRVAGAARPGLRAVIELPLASN